MSAFRYKHLDGVRVFALVALAMTILVGCGESGSSGSTVASTPATTHSGASAVGSTSVPAGRSTTPSTASTARPARVHSKASKAAASGPSVHVSVPVSTRVLRQFAGSGNTRLGTISVSSPELLVWSAQRPAIQIFTATGFILVNSKATSGRIQLSRGTYRGMRVATHASWSIQLRARP